MKKDIYIIINDINNKAYIGQAKNTAMRWSGHKSAAKCHGGFIEVDKAMAKIGIEHFDCKVLEAQVENYDEREQYWISCYNSKIPNGYNVESGGEGSKPGVESTNALIRDQRIIDYIIDQLKNTNKKLRIIGDECGISMKIVSAINRGTAYRKDDINYPIRKRGVDLLDEKDIKNIQYDLMYSKKSKVMLAKEYNLSPFFIRQICNGEKFHREDLMYPLRQSILTDEDVQKIIDMIKNTNLSIREIARRCNTSGTTVQSINSGRYHYNKNIIYPIR